MKNLYILFILCSCSILNAQSFIRTELTDSVSGSWEMTYGPDDHLWVTEYDGQVSRIDAVTGAKQIIYNAPDYYGGANSERSPFCHNPRIGSGTFGLALHPDFLSPSTPYIYYVHSYNSDVTGSNPRTRFKVVRLTWDPVNESVTTATDLITDLPNGYDHLGGRLMAIKRNGTSHLYLTIGDNGKSEDNDPTCYVPQSLNPNNFAQDPDSGNGKIHRFNMDGTIPSDNPIPGNSFYTRGHRNPQGLMYNPTMDVLYGVEHGDRTDDEVNVLNAGMNYGWKHVRGYHTDNNHPGEDTFIANYTPHSSIANDSLVPALYSWCTSNAPASANNQDWCTVAPSDGIYYGDYGTTGIPEWTNSLLVVTLKRSDTLNMKRAVWQFKLNPDGRTLVPSTTQDPNPKLFFEDDQILNGRLRDIAISPDGSKIYLCNNGSPTGDKIAVYTYDQTLSIPKPTVEQVNIVLFPNPVDAGQGTSQLSIQSELTFAEIEVIDLMGKRVQHLTGNVKQIPVANLQSGVYIAQMKATTGKWYRKKFVCE